MKYLSAGRRSSFRSAGRNNLAAPACWSVLFPFALVFFAFIAHIRCSLPEKNVHRTVARNPASESQVRGIVAARAGNATGADAAQRFRRLVTSVSGGRGLRLKWAAGSFAVRFGVLGGVRQAGTPRRRGGGQAVAEAGVLRAGCGGTWRATRARPARPRSARGPAGAGSGRV